MDRCSPKAARPPQSGFVKVGQCLRMLSFHMDVKRPTRAVEELHQVAATRMERRQPVQVTSPKQTSGPHR
jgi:hypothetical protein